MSINEDTNQPTKLWQYTIGQGMSFLLHDRVSPFGFLCKVGWNAYSGRFHKERGCPRGLMVKAMDCGIVVSEFELQLRYYVHFRENTLGKGMSPLILPVMG